MKIKRILGVLGIVGLAAGLFAGGIAWNYGPAFGVRKSARDLETLKGSKQWKAQDEVFENPQPLWNNLSVMAMIRAYMEQSDDLAPEDPASQLAQHDLKAKELEEPSKTGLRVTWFGHSSMFLEVDGKRFLIDPVWGASSPIPWLGPGRWIAPSITLDELPVPDAVVISHDHYDHLDYASISQIKDWETLFLVPLGVGQHLALWGVEPSKIQEFDWWQSHDFGELKVVATPARHASGRGVLDQNATLWSGWAFVGPQHRVYYSGDTGLFDGMKEIGEKLGPFDLSMIEVGQYHPNWPDWHLGPEQAVLAHQWVGAKKMLPVHWGAFTLAMHSWTAPMERTLVAANKVGAQVLTPRLCKPTEPQSEKPQAWWTPDIPYKSATEQPVVANGANGRPVKLQ